MVALIVAGIVALVAAAGTWHHARRVRRVTRLVFGPQGRAASWTAIVPWLQVLAPTAMAWGAVTLLLLPPKQHDSQEVAAEDVRHVLIVLDVSPSMRLDDAGPEKKISRMSRSREVMESFFERVSISQFRLSVVAVYNGAKPVVVDTNDIEVVRNVLSDLPMHYAFPKGKTDLFAGLKEAARISKPWRPKSATVLVISDGDTVPSTGIPEMPASVRDVVVVGVGDPVTGKFIDGRNSRQDTSTLRQIAVRLGGTYHDGNGHHLSSELLQRLSRSETKSVVEQLTLREFALLAIGIGSGLLALLPLLLDQLGTPWNWSQSLKRSRPINLPG